MTHSELIRALAERSGESQAAVGRILAALSQVLGDAALAEESVRISRVGTFSTKWRKASVIRDIQTGRRKLLGGRHVLTFRPAAALKQALVDRTDQSWKQPAHQSAWRLAGTLVSDLDLYHGSDKPTLTAGMSPAEVRKACEDALGEPWRHSVTTFDNQVAAEVTSTTDYLAGAAIASWSA